MVGRWVTLGRERRQAVREGRPDPREMEAEITALRRRVRELEKENEFLGKTSAFFASRHHNQRFELMEAHKGFLLDHCDGQGFRGHASRLLRVENRAPQRGGPVRKLNNILWARKCQTQSRHHPRRRRRVCHVRLGTRPWYASRAATRRSGGEESQRAGGEHEGGATAMTAKRNDGHTHLAGPPEGRAGATARDDTARDDTDVASVHARTSSTHAPQRRVAGPTRPNRARGPSGAHCRAGERLRDA